MLETAAIGAWLAANSAAIGTAATIASTAATVASATGLIGGKQPKVGSSQPSILAAPTDPAVAQRTAEDKMRQRAFASTAKNSTIMTSTSGLPSGERTVLGG